MHMDPATAIYKSLTRASLNSFRLIRLLTDDVTGLRYLEIVRPQSATYEAVYHVTTWPVSPAIPIPVIYFNLYSIATNDDDDDDSTQERDLVTDMDTLVDVLVPRTFRGQVARMPAISQGVHPVSGLPAYFVHPCQTESWMRIMMEGDAVVDVDELYCAWFRTFGQVVGLQK